MTLEAIALRSRAGKGPCQGSFCGIRIASYLYDRGYYRDKTGLVHMRRQRKWNWQKRFIADCWASTIWITTKNHR